MIAQDPTFSGSRSPVAASSAPNAGRARETRAEGGEDRADDKDFDTVLKGRPARKAARGEGEAVAETPAATAVAPSVPVAVVADAAGTDAAAEPDAMAADAAGAVMAAAPGIAADGLALAEDATLSGAGAGADVAEDAAGAETQADVAAPVIEAEALPAQRAGAETAAAEVEVPAAESGKAEGHRRAHGAGRAGEAAIPVAAVAKAMDEVVPVPVPGDGGEPGEMAGTDALKAPEPAAPRQAARSPEQAAPAAGTAGTPGVGAAAPAADALALAPVSGTAAAASAAPEAGLMRGEAANAAPAPQAAAVVGQVVVALGKAHEPKIEIRLDPPELGRVHIHLTPTDGGVQAVVAADRPETHDLLRRHADLLARELAEAGYSGVDLQFAAGGDTGTRQEARGALAAFEEVASVVAPLAGPVTAPVQAARLVAGGLDIRL